MLDEIQRLGGDAGLIAVSKEAEVVMPYNSDGMKRAAGGAEVETVVATFAD